MICNKRFEIKNLGVIKSGSFETKPLTLFCGPNNIGKTWTIYSLYHFYSFLKYASLPHPSISEGIANVIRQQETRQFNLIDWLQRRGKEIVDGFNKHVSGSLPELFNSPSTTFQGASFGVVMNIDDWTRALQASQKKTYKDKKETVRLVSPKVGTR